MPLSDAPASLSAHPQTHPIVRPDSAATPSQRSGFVDRRSGQGGGTERERRQFGSSHEGLSQAGRELALAIDRYKLENHRRYITCDEMLSVLAQLGYTRSDMPPAQS